MKKVGIIKRVLAVGLIFLLSINSFAASTGKNDGSAFITKAEFDSLKNNFQSQIDSYNQNIDSKIDSAIASYLSGISISKTMNKDILVRQAVQSGVFAFCETFPLKYKTCLPVAKLESTRVDISVMSASSIVPQPGNYTWGVYHGYFGPPADTSQNKGNKTVIKNLDTTKKIAAWEGFHENCMDTISGASWSLNNQWTTAFVGSNINNYSFNWLDCWVDHDFVSNKERILQNRQYPNGAICLLLYAEAIVHDWGTKKYPLVCVNRDYNYDLFSNYERDYNWSYPNTCGTKFILPGTTDKYIENERVTFPNGVSQNDNTKITKNIDKAWSIMTGPMSVRGYYAAPSGNGVSPVAGRLVCWTEQHDNYTWTDKAFNNQNGTSGIRTTDFYLPIIGFETSYLTKWNDIYMDQYDAVMDDDTMASLTTNTILTDKNGKKHLSSCAGFPLFKINKDEVLTEFKFSFDDSSANYNVWFKEGPFDKGDPNSNTCMDNISGYQMSGSTKVPITKETVSGKNKSYKMSGKETTISIPKSTKDSVIFVKWAKINASDRSKDGGGTFKPTSNYTVRNESD